MRVEPDEPERLVCRSPHPIGAGGHRAGREAVVAAEYERQRASLERLQHHSIESLADPGNVADVLLRSLGRFLRLGNRRWQVPLVDDRAAQGGDPIASGRYSKR